ncbi:sulfotransferase [Synechococcus sp. RedBA-s]|uniref:sulfotransferase family protein n=1 Tax=Synechococcus sp. RedBA-s TaxID=2823741 RepID=UPI0020CE4A8A|nr:sulfotransferase [Synechococcus sp. RedBA-s]MCP9799190.1 sulfotransferase [Synechococcus sp. RedBA-s]
MPLPHFLGLGAQKAGTTTLHVWLSSHPRVHLPAGKELQYFTLFHDRGADWYAEQFAAAGPGQRCGDITPYYLFHPAAPGRIRDLLPEIRLIVLLRDPVERTLSGLFHSLRLGLEPLPLEEALAAEDQRLAEAEAMLLAGEAEHHSHQVHSYLSRSRYEHQLERYEGLFPPHQLLVARSEDLFMAPDRLWPRLLAFLELPQVPPPTRLPRENSGRGEARSVDPALRQHLRHTLARTYDAMERRYGLRWP